MHLLNPLALARDLRGDHVPEGAKARYRGIGLAVQYAHLAWRSSSGAQRPPPTALLVQGADRGPSRRYESLRKEPWLSLSVAHDDHVRWWPPGNSGVVQVDFRLDVPWLLREPGPADRDAESRDDWRNEPWARASRAKR